MTDRREQFLELLYRAQPRQVRGAPRSPDDFEETCRRLVDVYQSSDDRDREAMRALATLDQLRPLFAFASQMSEVALRSGDLRDARAGLVALAIEGGRADPRDTIVVLTLLNRTAERLGIEGRAFLAEARGLSSDEWRAIVDDFLQFPRTVAQMGFEEQPAGYRQLR